MSLTTPDPNETVWTLGYGGVPWTSTATPGFALNLSTTLMNDGAMVPFTSGATLDASVWIGGNEAALFSPTIAWDTPNGGYAAGVVALAMPASSLAPLVAGDYRFQCGVTVSGVRSIFYDATFQVGDTTGSATLRVPYITDADLKIRYDQIDSLSNRRNDVTSFVNVCALVSNELDRELIIRFNPFPGDVLQRGLIADPYVGLDVSVTQPSWLNQTTIKTALAAQALIADYPCIEMLANRAIAYILERQETGSGNPYREEATAMRTKADAIWQYYRAQITISGGPSNTPNCLLVGNGAIILPTGTSP
jgi:hypothetical protein